MTTLIVKTRKKCEMIDITCEINKIILHEMKSGICHVFSMHTTAGLTINENADPAVRDDIIYALDKLIAADDPGFRHFEGNSAAHLKASLTGFSQLIPVIDGQLHLGAWQGVYFCEFDGPRTRSVSVQLLRDAGQ